MGTIVQPLIPSAVMRAATMSALCQRPDAASARLGVSKGPTADFALSASHRRLILSLSESWRSLLPSAVNGSGSVSFSYHDLFQHHGFVVHDITRAKEKGHCAFARA